MPSLLVTNSGIAHAQFQNSVYRLDLGQMKWELVTLHPDSSEAPYARYCHTAIVYQGSMYIFGGGDPDPREHLMDKVSLA